MTTLASATASWTYVPLTTANLDAALAVVADAAYRDDTSLVSGLESAGLTQLDLTGNGSGTFVAGNAAFDAWTTVVNGEPAAIIAFRGTDDINYSENGLTAYLQSSDAKDWLNTTGYYDLLADGVATFDATVTSLGIHQVYVTGHSLGGAAAQSYMAAHADTAQTSYTAVVFGSLGLSGQGGSWATDARVTAFTDPSDFTTQIGTQTAGLTISVATGDTSLSSSLDLSSLLSDPASYLADHSISLYAADAASYDAAKAGIVTGDATTFFTATAKVNGLTLTVSPT